MASNGQSAASAIEFNTAANTRHVVGNATLGAGVIRVETARPTEPLELHGNPVSWMAFRNRFMAEIHNNQQLDDVRKLIYLVCGRGQTNTGRLATNCGKLCACLGKFVPEV